MPVPTRPTTGGPIESSWGQESHDGLFTPAGGRWNIPLATYGDTTFPLDVNEDPSGWLTGGDGTVQLTVPADGDGFYSIGWSHQIQTDTERNLWMQIAINGARGPDLGLSDWKRVPIGHTAYLSMGGVVKLAIGDTLQLQSVINPGASLGQKGLLTLVRIGRTIGLA